MLRAISCPNHKVIEAALPDVSVVDGGGCGNLRYSSAGNKTEPQRWASLPRVFFRQAGDQIEIVGKTSKASEAKVINYLKSLY